MVESNSPLLEVKHLNTYFFTGKGVVPAVNDVSITVPRGKVVGIVGESGCGKSVTSLSIMQLVSPPGKIVGGQILFEGKDLLKYNDKQMCNIRGNEISMIFQEPMTSLNPVYTVGKQVSQAVASHRKDINKDEIKNEVIKAFDFVGIPEAKERFDAYPHQLSGGLRQRVMIAMALISNPKLLIADEPTTALDVTIEAQILKLMKDLQKRLNTSIIMITHNLGVVAQICDDVYVMYAGKIVEHADVFELFDNPMHPYTNGLLKSVPSKNIEAHTNRLSSIRGMVPNMLYPPKGCSFNPRCDEVSDICRQKEPELVDIGNGHCVRCFKYQK